VAKSKSLAAQVLGFLQGNRSCEFDSLVAECPEFTWNQLFHEVDRLSRNGQLCLTSVGGGRYYLTLPQGEGLSENENAQSDRAQTDRSLRAKGVHMTSDEQTAKMKKAIEQAIRVMKDRFGSTEKDVTKAIEELRASMKVDGVQTTTCSST